MKNLRSFLWLLIWLPVSCASDTGGGEKPAASAPAHKSLSQRLNENNGYKVDANGAWVPKSDQRSSFESKGQSPYFQGGYNAKQYQTGDYTTKSWWGNKDFGNRQYAGNTQGGRFQQSSSSSSRIATENGSSSKVPTSYQTSTYGTNPARETGTQGFTKPSSPSKDARQRYPTPDVIDWKEQRSLSLEQSKGILGR